MKIIIINVIISVQVVQYNYIIYFRNILFRKDFL